MEASAAGGASSIAASAALAEASQSALWKAHLGLLMRLGRPPLRVTSVSCGRWSLPRSSPMYHLHRLARSREQAVTSGAPVLPRSQRALGRRCSAQSRVRLRTRRPGGRRQRPSPRTGGPTSGDGR